jgi:hypothetical protein
MGLVAGKAMANLQQAMISLGFVDPNGVTVLPPDLDQSNAAFNQNRYDALAPYLASYHQIIQAWGFIQSQGVAGVPARVNTQEMMQFEDGTSAPNGKFVPSPLGPVFLLDNFQYWKDARSMGWTPEEPDYPVFGAGIGYGDLGTVVDFEEGSRVLDVARNPSVFLPFNSPQLVPYTISKTADIARLTGRVGALPNCFPTCSGASYCGMPLPGLYSELTFKVRAPLSLERFDMFRFEANVLLTDGTCAKIILLPRDLQAGCNIFGADTVSPPDGGYVPAPRSDIEVFIGRQFQDSSWHVVRIDLEQVVQNYTNGAAGLLAIVGVEVKGDLYRLDDIMFTIPASSLANNNPPYLFRVGPVYATLFGDQTCPPGVLPSTCSQRLIFAEDPDLHMSLDCLYDENGLQFGQPGFGTGLANNDFFLVDLPGQNPVDLTPIVTNILTAQGGGVAPTPAQVAAALPIFMAQARPTQNLNFTLTMDGPLGPQVNGRMATEIPIVDNGGNPTVMNLIAAGVRSLPQWEEPADEWVKNDFDADAFAQAASPAAAAAIANVNSNPMYALATALVNAGYNTLPGVLLLRPAQGQVFEDMIVTARVDDGFLTDEETFPISVVNYPVTNLPPLIEQLEDQFFAVNKPGTYQITATDPDVQDMGQLTYEATLNGLPSYSYGPWSNSIINPATGTISFTPQFEGALTCIVTVRDPRGLAAVGHFTIFAVNGGSAGATWLNHAPIVARVIQSPQEVIAGDQFVLTNLHMADPDNQPLYYSCNIGAVGVDGIYTFQSEFPGEYLVQITGYDPMGGAVTQQFVLNVLPWWSI